MWPFRRQEREQVKEIDPGGSGGFGQIVGIHYTRRSQPDPGIAAYSYDTLALPITLPAGPSVQNLHQNLMAPSNPVVWQNQAVGLTTIGNPGYLAGTFRSSPLIETTQSDIPHAAVYNPGEFELDRRSL